MSELESKDWLLRIGDGDHFWASSPKHIWGISSLNPNGIHFKNNVKEGDRLWFVKTGGMLIGVAIYNQPNKKPRSPYSNYIN